MENRDNKGSYEANNLVLALSAPATALLLKDLLPTTSSLIQSIPQAPVAVIHSVFSKDDWDPPDGFGLLCPNKENVRSLGVLFSSSTFPDHAPVNQILLRSILGGRRDAETAHADPQRIQQWALDDLKTFFPGCPEPLWQSCYKPPDGIRSTPWGIVKKSRSESNCVASAESMSLATG